MAQKKRTDSGEDDYLLEVSGLEKSFDNQKVLKGIDLKIRRGETLVIIGGSGEGKSVLLKHLVGLIRPDAGKIEVDGRETTTLSERELYSVRAKFGILFQEGALFGSLNVAENVAFPLMEGGLKDRQAIFERVREALEVVELEDHMEKMPVKLSGGMRKRVALARAIITRPECILYDEPTSGLDPVVSDSINILIRRLQREFEVTSIAVTHDMSSVFHIADRVAYLRGGKIYFYGTTRELKEHEDPVVQDFIQGRSEPRKNNDGNSALS